MSAKLKPFESYAHIKVVGVGSDGCNYLDRIIEQGLDGVKFVAIHSDLQTLARSTAPVHVHIGPKTTRGLGAGYDSEIGRKAAEESAEDIYNVLKSADMIFVIAGMSGGTGTGAAPIIAQIGLEIGALTVGVVTTPYELEGTKRLRAAAQGIRVLDDHTDSLFIFSKEKLLALSDERTSLKEVAKRTEDFVYKTVQGIVELITTPGLINLDFSDVRSVIKEGGREIVGFGQASGVERAQKATELAISTSSLIGSIGQANNILLNLTGGPNFSLFEVNQAARIIRDKIHPDAGIIFGSIIDPEIGDSVSVTVYATGIDHEKMNFKPSLRPGTKDISENFPSEDKIEPAFSKQVLQVFLCHASGDKPAVRDLYHKLSQEKYLAPWLDEINLLPGEQWDLEIKKAVRNSDAVIVCLSRNSISKEGYIQKEIKFALDIADEKPDGTIFIIPLKLEECDVPGRLRNWQWVNYSEEGAFERLMKSLRKRADTIGINLDRV